MSAFARSDTRREILNWLKYTGPQDASDLSGRLEISAMAVRQHLYALQREQLVTYKEESRPLGRPAKLWELTRAADRLFPDGHADLTVELLASMRRTFGDEGMERLLVVRTRRQIAEYRKRLPDGGDLRRRLGALARVRTDEGYMAEVVARPPGSYLFIENHCSICDAARACTGLCGSELDVFRAVLGAGVAVERREHILSGDRRCVYDVRAQLSRPGGKSGKARTRIHP